MTGSKIHDNIIPMKRITVDIPDDLYERMRLAAYTGGTSVSEIVRRLAGTLPALPSEEEPQSE